MKSELQIINFWFIDENILKHSESISSHIYRLIFLLAIFYIPAMSGSNGTSSVQSAVSIVSQCFV